MPQQITSDIHEILLTSRHSPSSHNTQPWKVQVDAKKAEVVVGFNPDRQLLVGDSDMRELYISLGCFIESFSLAAQDKGYAVITDYLGNAPSGVALLRLKKQPGTSEPWSKLINTRRSDRRLYENRSLDPAAQAELLGLRDSLASLHLFTSPKEIAVLSRTTHAATLKAMSNPHFRTELAGWIRNNWTKKPDGMPAYVQGIPGPVSLLAKVIIKKNKAVAKDQAKKDAKRVSRSAAVGLICTAKQNPEAWLAAGRLYQRACLVSLKHDVKTAGLSAAVVDVVTSRQLETTLKLPSPPLALLRFGYAKKAVKASPRLSLSHFVTEK